MSLMESNKSCLNWRQKYGVPFEKTDLTLKLPWRSWARSNL